VSAQSSFIADVHKDLYAFYTGKSDLLQKCWGQQGTLPSPPLLLNSPLPRLTSALDDRTGT